MLLGNAFFIFKHKESVCVCECECEKNKRKREWEGGIKTTFYCKEDFPSSALLQSKFNVY